MTSTITTTRSIGDQSVFTARRGGGDFCGRITWFSGETDKGSVIDNRV